MGKKKQSIKAKGNLVFLETGKKIQFEWNKEESSGWMKQKESFLWTKERKSLFMNKREGI